MQDLSSKCICSYSRNAERQEPEKKLTQKWLSYNKQGKVLKKIWIEKPNTNKSFGQQVKLQG